MSIPASRLRLVVIDDNRMRQAGIVSLISDWAHDLELQIRQISTKGVLRELEQSDGCRLVLFSIGGTSIRASEARGIVRILHALAPDAPVVVVSDRDEPEEIVSAYQASCSGYIPTSMDPALALQAMGFILDGGSYFPPSALRLVAAGGSVPDGSDEDGDDDSDYDAGEGGDGVGSDGGSDGAPQLRGERPSVAQLTPVQAEATNEPRGLTGRQFEVLQCLQKGQPNKLIARELGMTEGTVKVHVRQIMRKLGATNRTQVAILAATTRSVAVRVQARAVGRMQ